VTQRWAYLGPEGTFTEQAVRSILQRSPEVEVQPMAAAGVSAALQAVRSGDAAAACVPLENSVEGGVPLTQDELAGGEPLVITAEAFVPITFHLLVRPGTTLEQVRSVGSHPHGHAQVREWLALRLPAADIVVTSSTAAAAAAVAAGELDAAAAAPVAGERLGLHPIAQDIGAVRNATTRFVLLRRPGPPPPPTGNDRTSLILSIRNEPGALLDVLAEIAGRGINLTRLESRPTRSKLGEYVFHIDADGHIADPAMADMVATLIRRSVMKRWLGSYPRMSGSVVPLPTFATSAAYDAAQQGLSELLSGEPKESN
jgi:prephenate dehydratase